MTDCKTTPKLGEAYRKIGEMREELFKLERSLTTTSFRGRPFIALTQYGIERNCGNCFYGGAARSRSEHCTRGGGMSEFFGMTGTLPHRVDDVEVGHYCTGWLPFDQE